MLKIQMMLFVVTSAADLVFTLWGTARVGYGAEFNPVARAILVAGGPTGLSIFKLSGVCLVLALTAILARYDKAWGRLTAKILLLLGSLIAGAGAWSWLPVLTSVL